MPSRKGDAALNANGSAILIIIITALIVLYILFLPPQERAELLGEKVNGDGSGGNGGSTAYLPTQTLLEENVGRIDYLSVDEREHTVPSFRISTTTGGSVIKSVDSLYVKSSVFDSVVENVTFRIDEDLASNLKLSFNTGGIADGRLIVLLNGQRLIQEEVAERSSQVIDLPADGLQRYNTLTFGASSPGWAFWKANEYQLLHVQVIGDVKDVSGATSRQVFTLDDEEVDNLDRALLKFYPDCASSSAGRLTVELNGREVYSSYADCGVMNTVELNPRLLDWGENDLVFTTSRGSYLVTNVAVKVLFKEPVFPVYYFEFDEEYFVSREGEERCGEIDGECPDGCGADLDKDCCFEDGSDNYWCDVETDQLGDRCVSFVTASTCGRCDSGYEDRHGDPAEACEGLCGDDEDGECLAGCSKYLDKDCCFAAGDNYWCDDVPLARPLSSVCKAGVEPDERSACPGRYYNDDGRRLSYTADGDDGDEDLKSAYKAVLLLDFPDQERKSATLFVNGRAIGVDTYDIRWERDVSSYVRPGTNSIRIEPSRTIDIASLEVVVKRK
ncbi:hypothetical protein JXA12_03665 [Candidatus Woesearchaeota archaeon]|nr:hypothetical protein [Candidatus Woesearchaeota archaeon]